MEKTEEEDDKVPAMTKTEDVDDQATKKAEDVDDIVRSLKTWGRYNSLQLFYIFICFIPVSLPLFIIIFIGYPSNHQCKPLSRPLSKYDFGISDNNTNYIVDYGQCDITVKSNATNSTYKPVTAKCPEGFVYDIPRERTIVSEWDLICDNMGLGELSQTLIMLGQAIGAGIFTSLSDRYGRKFVFTWTFLATAVLSVGTAFVPSYLAFIVVRIVSGAIQQGLGLSMYALAIEMFPLESRGSIAGIAGIFWAGTVIILTGFFYVLKNLSWRHVQLATLVFSIHSLFGYWLMDESLRWLVANNKRTKAVKLIKKMAKRNNKDPSEALSILCMDTNPSETPFLQESKHWKDEINSVDIPNGVHESEPVSTQTDKKGKVVERYSLLDIFKHRVLLRNSLIIWYTWAINSLTYYGLFLNSTSLSGDRFLNFLINGVIEIPSGLLVWYFMNRIGRKKTSILFHTTAGLSLIISVVLLVQDDPTGKCRIASIAFSFIGKFGVTGSWTTMALYTPELYPTNLRNAGLGAASAAARFGSMLAPYSNVLAKYILWGPGVIFGVGCMLVNIGMLFLPETMGVELPQSMDELLQFYQGKSHNEHSTKNGKKEYTMQIRDIN